MTPANRKAAHRLLGLVAWRKRLGLTQAAAAQALGVSRRQLQNYEAGAWPAPLTIRLAMAALEAGIAAEPLSAVGQA